MIVEAVSVKNYRSVKQETLACDNLTALVGSNGAGKSCFLRALELFYSNKVQVDIEDFYAKNILEEISVAITYVGLSAEAKKLFSSYMQDEKLTVERIFKNDNGRIASAYHGSSLQNPDFTPTRLATNATDKKEQYNTARTLERYSSLAAWKNQTQALAELEIWEKANRDKLTRLRDDGRFFGFQSVGQGYLGRFTKFLFIPAIREAADDAEENRGSVLTDLMDLVVRSVIANKEDLKKLRTETRQKYLELMDPTKLKELGTLEDALTKTLKTFVPEANINLSWLALGEIEIPLPKADVKLEEDGFSTAVSRTGHGLQRAFILTLLQHLTLAQTGVRENVEEGVDTGGTFTQLPDLILAIEEPELYQHPNRQRHFAQILMLLADGKIPGVAERTQVIYCTHSPLFVGIDRIHQLRVLRKFSEEDGQPKVTRIVQTNLDKIAQVIWIADGSKGTQYTGETLRPRLQSLMTPWMSEGFFADVVVLVEGEDDRAAILGIAKSQGRDLERDGFAIIPCGGKTSLDRPATIFSELGIPVYLIWDGDKGIDGAKAEENHKLLRLLGDNIVDWPTFNSAKGACFEKNLETTLSSEFGERDFNGWLENCQVQYGIAKRKYAIKNPHVLSDVIQRASKEGKSSKSMNAILAHILALKKK